ncbi:MAG: hypothetical protein IPJ48_19155 [Propionivibrio sp.]|uniref:Nucleotidyltransferase-like domain-containing protein n=1 Tax=Candidatus Propionivibrio dominans TaxID=2954373 RepID=A0A9D7FA69_9RHOO|nr:hypothetical protein [Candidatus Propionivibrio dominans]
MDYLLGGKSWQGLVIGAYAIPVNLPDPARFSIHKLVIAQERSLNFETKSAKDIRQASEVIEALVEIGRESDLQRALSDLLATGSKKPLENLEKSVARMNGTAKAVLLGEMHRRWRKAEYNYSTAYPVTTRFLPALFAVYIASSARLVTLACVSSDR